MDVLLIATTIIVDIGGKTRQNKTKAGFSIHGLGSRTTLDEG